jgi:hypothetical protein
MPSLAGLTAQRARQHDRIAPGPSYPYFGRTDCGSARLVRMSRSILMWHMSIATKIYGNPQVHELIGFLWWIVSGRRISDPN